MEKRERDVREVKEVLKTVPERLRVCAQTVPDHTAFCYQTLDQGWERISWETFYQDVICFASFLKSIGISKGMPVAIFSSLCVGWEMADKAILQCAGIVVGIDPKASFEKIAYILDHSEASVLIVRTDDDITRIPMSAQKGLKAIVILEGTQRPLRQNTNIYFWPQEKKDIFAPDAESWPKPCGEDPAILIYTSGTTKDPKGILYTHRQIALASRVFQRIFPEVISKDVTVCWLPLSNLFQRMANLWMMNLGAATYIVEDPRNIGEHLRQIQPSFFIAVPRFYEKLAFTLRHKSADELLGKNMKFMFTGSSAINPEIVTLFHSKGIKLLEAYGLSENIIPMAMNRPQCYRAGTVGMPLRESEIRIAADGEILVKGEGVFSGYYKEPAKNNPLTLDGYLATGDLGAYDRDGFLILTGRKKDLIKTSTGHRIHPVAIEQKFQQIGSIDHCVVVGHHRKGLVALLTFQEGTDMCEPGFCDKLYHALVLCNEALSQSERILGFALLRTPFSVDEGELTGSLKLRRHVIESKYSQDIEALYQALEYRGSRLQQFIVMNHDGQIRTLSCGQSY